MHVSHAFVFVHDQDEALGFYRDIVGMEVRTDAEMGGLRWLSVGAPGQAELEVVLLPPGYGHTAADEGDLSALLAKGSLFGVILHVDDVDACFARMVEAGVEVIQEPTDMPWGMRDAAVRDPSGNMVRIGRPG